MRKQNTSTDWLFTENDAEWERLQALLPLEITPARRRRLQLKRSLWSLATILVLLAGTGEGWRRTTQAKLDADETELRSAVQQKPLAVVMPDGEALVATIRNEWSDADWRPQYGWADTVQQNNGLPTRVQPGDSGSGDHAWEDYGWKYSGLPAPVQPDEPIAPLEVVIQSMEVLGNQAIANVILNDQNRKPAFRQTRFYQHTFAGWLPMPPDATLWGVELTLETPYFVYHFRQRDAAVVQAAAPQIDAFYATLGHNFGLPISPTPEQLIIDVSVTQPPGEEVGWVKRGTPFLVPSPAMYLAPAELTDADLLAQSLAFPLIDHVLAQARHQHAISERWQPLLDGLSLWQLWDASLPVANWHEEVVRWLYDDLPAIQPAQPTVLPQHYTELYARHKLWMKTPTQVHIPLVCGGQDWEERYWKLWLSRSPLTRLEQLAVPGLMPTNGPQFLGYHPGQVVALATLIEYAVATHGRERLPVLLAGIGDYDSWATLIPAVYGVSAAEFEAGWQAYLAAHYGVVKEHS